MAEKTETIVTIKPGVTKIPDSCFKGLNVKKVKIADGVISIGSKAFMGCKSLEEVIIPDSVTGIGERAFCGCISLKKVKLSNSLKKIEAQTFKECYNLTAIEIPDSVSSLATEAFAHSGLKTIKLSNSLTTLYFSRPSA